VAGPVGRIRDRLTGFPDVTTSIQDMFVSGNKLAVTLTLQDQFAILKRIGYLRKACTPPKRRADRRATSPRMTARSRARDHIGQWPVGRST
jgi:hypothetical protein